MTEDNNSTNETIDTPVKKTRKKKSEVLTKCKVLKGHCIKEGEFIPLYQKNSEGMYVTHRVETKSGSIRLERTVNEVNLNLADLKSSLKLKAVEVID